MYIGLTTASSGVQKLIRFFIGSFLYSCLIFEIEKISQFDYTRSLLYDFDERGQMSVWERNGMTNLNY
jgi:hypothetical protein